MPLYEYRCAACGKPSTSLLATWASPDPPCEHCGSPSVGRLISSFATHRTDGGGGGGDLDDFGDGGGDDDYGGSEDAGVDGFDEY
ncbi:MAG: zinc ribbon domain-containing protein [Candidatus Dormibacteraeota bacterium]|nr:zinc ribbon domain-containing protein [Candidatus Dormibacteraeota bacterium]